MKGHIRSSTLSWNKHKNPHIGVTWYITPKTPLYYIGALTWFGCDVWNLSEDRFWKAGRSVVYRSLEVRRATHHPDPRSVIGLHIPSDPYFPCVYILLTVRDSAL